MAEDIRRRIIIISENIIAYGLPVLYFIIAAGFYLKTYDSAQIKITFMQIGGAVLIAVWLIKLVEEDISGFFKKYFVVIFPLIAFLLSGIISHLHSAFPYASANELIRRVMYMAFAMIAISEFNSERKFGILFNWLIAAAFVASIYGLVQFLDTRFFPSAPEPGLDPFMWRGAFGDRIFSTFGNPNFFGDFLVVMSPIVLALFFAKKHPHLIVLWLLIVFSVIFTFSKGAWLGFVAGLIVFAFLYVGFFLRANKKVVRSILAVMLIGIFLVMAVGMTKQLKQRSDSASFRIFTWISTFEMIKTSPIIGTGIGTFYVTYPAWRRPQIFFIEGKHNTETDHSENEYLEVWFDEGTVGFGIFILVIVSFLVMGIKNLRILARVDKSSKTHNIKAYYQLGLLTAVIAQLVHNSVCVSLRFVSSGVMLWLFLGLIGSLAINKFVETETPEVPKKNILPETLRRVVQFLIIAAMAYFVSVFWGYLMADIEHNKAIFFSKQGNWQEALKTYEGVARKNPSYIMAYYFMGNVYNDRWADGDADRAIYEYENAWKLAPNYVQSHHQAGLIYLKAGQDKNMLAQEAMKRGDIKAAQKHDEKKEELWQKALEQFRLYQLIDPIFSFNYYRQAWIYMQLGKQEDTERVYREHVEFPEKLKSPPHSAWVEDWGKRRGSEYAESYMNLGNLRYMKGDYKKAEEYYDKALEYYPTYTGVLKNLAILYANTGRRDKAAQVWNKLREIAPEDADVKRAFGIK